MKELLTSLVLFLSTSKLVDAKSKYDFTYFEDIDGWMRLNVLPETWDKALWSCSSFGGMLASPVNDAFYTHMLKSMPDKGSVRYYTGLNSMFISKDHIHSVEGVPMEHLAIGPIIGPHKGRGCVVMDGNGIATFNDCNEPLQYVCYRNKTEPKILPCGSKDTEYTIQPCHPAGCYERYCNKFHKTPKTWSEAYKTCASEGAYLAVLTVDEEAAFLKQMYTKTREKEIDGSSKPNIAYIGFRNWNDNRHWITVRGVTFESIDGAKWGPSGPYKEGEGGCGAINREGEFRNIDCDKAQPFFCEKRSNTLYDLD